MEAVSLPLGRGMTVYSSPPPYPAQGLGTVVVVVVSHLCVYSFWFSI